MSDDLVFYTNPMSRGRMVRWMLEEVGQPYRTEIIDYTSVKSPSFLAINPMGKLPALRHGGATVTETAAIITYLADAFPAAGLAPPPGSTQRAPYYRWLFFGAGPIEAAITNKALGVDVPPDRARMVGYGSMQAVMDVLEHAVSGEAYLLGEHFSAADVYIGSQIGFGLRFKSIEPRPAFSTYWDRLKNRPAHLRANEIDDTLIAESKK